MHHGVRTSARLDHGSPVAQIGPQRLGASGEQPGHLAEVAAQQAHALAVGEQAGGDVAAKKAAAAGYQYAHRCGIVSRTRCYEQRKAGT